MSAKADETVTAKDSDARTSFFSGPRVRLFVLAVALAYGVTLAIPAVRYFWLGQGFDARYCRDFTWIWLSGKLAASASPVAVYDHALFAAAREALVGPPACPLGHFDYPLSILFFTYPLGLLPYIPAYAVWIASTLALYLFTVRAIVPGTTAALAALAPFPVWFNVLLGHNGFLTAGLIGLALLTIEKRPWLAGLFLALLTYKPQFGILFPIALIAERNWRVLASAGVCCLLLFAATALVFGAESWPAFFGALNDRAASVSADPLMALPLVSLLSLLAIGVRPGILWTLQLALAGGVALAVAIVWARRLPYEIKAATLAIGAVLASPHVFGYDLCILTIGAAFLVKDALGRGFLRGERGGILACWINLFLLTGPIPMISAFGLLALALRRAFYLSADRSGHLLKTPT